MQPRASATERRPFRRNKIGATALSGCIVAVAFVAGGTSVVLADSDYDAKGMPLGAFRLFPTMPIAATYDDNVYRTETNQKSSTLFTIAPALALKSQWSQNMLELDAGLNALEYSGLTDESRIDWNVGGKGRLDIVRGADLITDASYLSTHELRTSPDQPGSALKPTPYTQLHAGAKVEDQPTSFGFSAGIIFDQLTYAPTALPGGVALNNADRNESSYEFWAKAGYEFSPGYAVFLRGAYDETRYDLSIDRTGVDRNSDGYTIDGGLDMLVTDLIKGQIFIGYLNENYITPLRNVSGLNYGAGIEWLPTPLLTVKLNAARTLVPTVIAQASTEDDAHVDGELDYAFLSDVVGQAYVGYTDAAFAGTSRDDRTLDAWVGVKYLMNRYMNADFRYEYANRTSTAPGQNYHDQIIMLGLNLQE